MVVLKKKLRQETVNCPPAPAAEDVKTPHMHNKNSKNKNSFEMQHKPKKNDKNPRKSPKLWIAVVVLVVALGWFMSCFLRLRPNGVPARRPLALQAQ